MDNTKIKLTINGKSAELSIEDAREMFRQLKAVFGDAATPTIIPNPIPQTPTSPYAPVPWLPQVWCRAGDDCPFTLTTTSGLPTC